MEVRRRIHRDETAWREIFARQAASGLLVSQFCRQEQINPGVFRRWREVLQVSGPAAGKPIKAVRVQRPRPFVDLGALGASGSRCEIRLELGGGVTLSVVRETSNHPLLLCPKGMVVNEWEKLRRDRGRYVSRR